MGCDIPQPLIHFAIGNINSSGLPRKMYQPVPVQQVSPYSIAESVSIANVIKQEKHNEEDEESEKSSSEETDRFFVALRTALKRESDNKKTSTEELKAKLEELSDTTNLAHAWLVNWYRSLLERNVPSTVRTYHSAIGRLFLSATEGESPKNLSSDDFEALYVRHLNNKRIKNMKSLNDCFSCINLENYNTT